MPGSLHRGDTTGRDKYLLGGDVFFEMLRKIKQEPMDSTEVSPSLLANAKSAYRNGLYSSEDSSSYEGLKRKSADSEHFVVKRGRFIPSGSEIYSPGSLSDVSPRSSSSVGEKSFECSLCEEKFSSEEDRICHITLVHKSKSNTGRRNSTRFARHTCQICFARFRTLKDFFSHTNCHAESVGLSAIQKSINESIANNNLQRFFAGSLNSASVSDIFQTAFKCDCCDRIFSNRDSYAMHVMMRVKNDACKQQSEVSNGEKEQWRKLGERARVEKQVKKDLPSPKPDVLTADLNKASYIDVTNSTEKDEYLQSFLEQSVERLCNQNMALLLKDSRKCMICHEVCADKDALAMHVMSHHTNGLSAFSTQNRHTDDKISPLSMRMPASFVRLMQGSTTEEKKSTKAAQKKLWCEFCKIDFVDHDSLAMHILNHTLSEVNEKEKREGSPMIKASPQFNIWEASRKFASYNELPDSPLDLVRKRETLPSSAFQKRNERNEHFADTKQKMIANEHEEASVKITDYPASPRQIQRCASVPDIRQTIPEVPGRPASAEGIGKRYEYVLDNASIECVSKEKSTKESPTDLSKPKEAVKPEELVEKRSLAEVHPENDKRPSSAVMEEFSNPHELFKHLNKPVYFCRFCDIIFLNRTTFYLHKGLHNVNNPWQCNMCGQTFSDVHDFSAHVIHP